MFMSSHFQLLWDLIRRCLFLLTSLQAVSIRVWWVLTVWAGYSIWEKVGPFLIYFPVDLLRISDGKLAIFQLDIRERFKKDIVIMFWPTWTQYQAFFEYSKQINFLPLESFFKNFWEWKQLRCLHHILSSNTYK